MPKTCLNIPNNKKIVHFTPGTSGIDNYTADGYKGFEMITKILERLPLPKEDKNVLKSSLKSALVCLKGSYHLGLWPLKKSALGAQFFSKTT